MRKYRVFLDANILFSAAYKPESRLNDLLHKPELSLITSAYALDEAVRNLQNIRPDNVQYLNALMKSVSVLPDNYRMPVRSTVDLPDKDRPILDAAIQGRADILITGDFKHFGSLLGSEIEGCTILSPALLWQQISK